MVLFTVKLLGNSSGSAILLLQAKSLLQVSMKDRLKTVIVPGVNTAIHTVEKNQRLERKSKRKTSAS